MSRTDTATLTDYADDVMAAVKWLSKRDDVDRKRIVAAKSLPPLCT